MSNVDLSKIKPGDEVTVRAVVGNINPAGFPERPFLIELRGSHGTTSTRMAGTEIVSHTPKALAVGDRVKLAPCSADREKRYADARGEIVHVHEGRAWVDWPTAMLAEIWALAALRRADD